MGSDDVMQIQFGVSVDDDGVPVVLMILPEVENPETGEAFTLSLGDAYSVGIFAQSALRTAQVCEAVECSLDGDESKEDVERIMFDCASLINAEYN